MYGMYVHNANSSHNCHSQRTVQKCQSDHTMTISDRGVSGIMPDSVLGWQMNKATGSVVITKPTQKEQSL